LKEEKTRFLENRFFLLLTNSEKIGCAIGLCCLVINHPEMYGGSREFICKDAHTRQEAMQLIEAGFDYVLTDKEGVSLFRKLK
jgi:hypothetical protein